MAKTAGSPRRFTKHFALFPDWREKRLEHQLRDAVPSSQAVRHGGGIQKIDQYFPPVVGVDKSHALGHGKTLGSAEAAAGINETGNSGPARLNGDACGDDYPLAGRDFNFRSFLGQGGDKVESG